MNRLLVAAALTVAVGVSGHPLSVTPTVAPQDSSLASGSLPVAQAASELLANRGGGSGNDVIPNQRPSYLS